MKDDPIEFAFPCSCKKYKKKFKEKKRMLVPLFSKCIECFAVIVQLNRINEVLKTFPL